jgi:hypothetical protein
VDAPILGLAHDHCASNVGSFIEQLHRSRHHFAVAQPSGLTSERHIFGTPLWPGVAMIPMIASHAHDRPPISHAGFRNADEAAYESPSTDETWIPEIAPVAGVVDVQASTLRKISLYSAFLIRTVLPNETTDGSPEGGGRTGRPENEVARFPGINSTLARWNIAISKPLGEIGVRSSEFGSDGDESPTRAE